MLVNKKFKLYLLGIIIVSIISCENKTDDKKPLLSIISPPNNYLTHKGDTVIIAVQANSPNGLLHIVDFLIDNQKVYEATIEPYKYDWYTARTNFGHHTIKITATDISGASTSQTLNINLGLQNPDFQTLPLSFIGTTLAISGVNVNTLGTPAISTTGICWNKTGSPTTNDNELSKDALHYSSFPLTMTGLELGTNYFIRAFAQNDDTILYANEVNFKTSSSYFSDTGSFVDNRDLTRYKWVKIGDQVWMAENFRYRTSGIIKYETTEDSVKYGYLYGDRTAFYSAPQGWHLPKETEWFELINYVGGNNIAGGILKESGTTNWGEPNEGANNSCHFSARPGGCYSYSNYDYIPTYTLMGINQYSYFWMDSHNSEYPGYFRMDYNSRKITHNIIMHSDPYKYCSVRYIKD